MKLKEVTPKQMRCAIGSCPGLYKTDRNTVLIIGKQIKLEQAPSSLKSKIGPGEILIEAPLELFEELRN